MSSVIKVENLSKQYRLGDVGTGTISHDVNRWWHKIRGKEDPYLKIGDANDRASKGESDYVWALKDINFEVKQGEVLGIIGRNGAGKSTLLKILSRTTAPTTGSVKIKGRVASLLEVGTGFHPELSGRDNIFLNGAIMGMTRREIQSKFDEIVDFAGVERYIDTPVKRYSSGMYVRLAFAVAAHLEPEILIVDEVLAVGDAEFQKKCLGKMKDVSERQGRTVLFVSHNMGFVKSLCTEGLFFQNGILYFMGNIDQTIVRYIDTDQIPTSQFQLESFIKQMNDDVIQVKSIELLQNNLAFNNVNPNEVVKIIYKYTVKKHIYGLRIGFDLIDVKSDIVVFRSFHDDLDDLHSKIDPGHYELESEIFSNILNPGTYKIIILIGIHNVRWVVNGQLSFQISVSSLGDVNKSYSDFRPGIISPKLKWLCKRVQH
jgi:lipopolysaccharide transport system ATP-binding protein